MQAQIYWRLNFLKSLCCWNLVVWPACVLVFHMGITGCSSIHQAKQRLLLEGSEFHAESGMERLHESNRHAAEAAFRVMTNRYETSVTIDQRDGFIAGYASFLQFGGNGATPPVPPRKFWDANYQTSWGQQAVQNWYTGFRQGSSIARANGLPKLLAAPAGDAGSPVFPQASPYPTVFINSQNKTPSPSISPGLPLSRNVTEHHWPPQYPNISNVTTTEHPPKRPEGLPTEVHGETFSERTASPVAPAILTDRHQTTPRFDPQPRDPNQPYPESFSNAAIPDDLVDSRPVGSQIAAAEHPSDDPLALSNRTSKELPNLLAAPIAPTYQHRAGPSVDASQHFPESQEQPICEYAESSIEMMPQRDAASQSDVPLSNPPQYSAAVPARVAHNPPQYSAAVPARVAHNPPQYSAAIPTRVAHNPSRFPQHTFPQIHPVPVHPQDSSSMHYVPVGRHYSYVPNAPTGASVSPQPSNQPFLPQRFSRIRVARSNSNHAGPPQKPLARQDSSYGLDVLGPLRSKLENWFIEKEPLSPLLR